MSDRPDEVLRLPEVKQRTGLSRTTIYRLMDQGLFPANRKIGIRAVGWKRSLIDAFVATGATN
ncbi:helix-turn-helix transcriptional regulator [Sphingomonas arantia]|uniref:Helix-turn-helix transcriptional regulator n=2 Tax=Sphingomonas arantia TaxID=1460676 RepID=A0ABW4TVI1_9SPHN